MGKVGSIFRDARLGKGLTLEQVSDETNISRRFLQGIETDNFEGFPGEVYILGFLKNYAEFLGLDAARVVDLYRRSEAEPEQGGNPPPSADAGASDLAEKAEAAPSPEPLPPPVAEAAEKKQEEEALAQPQTQAPSLFSEMEEKESPAPAPSDAPKKRKTTAKKKPRAKPEVQERQAKDQVEPQVIEIKEPSPPIQAPQASRPQNPPKSKSAYIQAGRVLPFILVGLVLLIAAISIIPKLNLPSGANRAPAEYRAEGLPFEQRLYPQDKVYLPLGDDFISITLRAIKDKVSFDTPYGALTTGLNEDAVINPSADNERLIATVTDYAPNEPKNGALVHFDAKEALSQSESPGDISVPAESGPGAAAQAATPQGQASQGQTAPVVLFRSSGGPHPFYVNVNFMSPVLFRYEADRKEWVEKYYRKGESITINASNGITFWTANAQAVKVSVFQSAGKSTELMMGGPGEISVQRLAWSNAQGGWAMVAAPMD